jgi:HAD superfamily hydrolase (TIGR01509 family)
LHDSIWKDKQEITAERLQSLEKDDELVMIFSELKKHGYKIACCSNSIKKTVEIVLLKLGISQYFDQILSNEDVLNSKPHPEIYWKCISSQRFLPEEVLILEDSPYGLLAASKTSAHIMRVDARSSLSLNGILRKISELNEGSMKVTPKWKDEKLNILIPMAGAGSRFEKAGYTFPKPLIDVQGEPMIKLVSENLNFEANFIYIVQKSHREKYNLDTLLGLISPNCTIVEIDGITEGAACTTLLAKDFIDNDYPLVLANSDQFIDWDSNEFMYKMTESKLDGGIVTFKATHPKWSFVRINDKGYVTEVAEKNPISDIATVGVYYWSKGSDYVHYAEQMIAKNIRVNNEFYVCPVFNEAILDAKKIKTFQIEKMWGLGTPEDLTVFLNR